MTGRKRRPLACGLLVLALAALNGGPACGQEILRVAHQVPGDAKPIVLYADEIATWLDGSQRCIVLKGHVLVEHGIVHTRTQQAVGWVDLDRYKRTGVMQLELYAEGDVSLEKGPQKQNGAQALLTLGTRGEIKLRCHKGKVDQQARAEEPVVKRAVAARSTPPANNANAVQRTSYQTPFVPPTQPTPPAQPATPPAGSNPFESFGNPPPATPPSMNLPEPPQAAAPAVPPQGPPPVVPAPGAPVPGTPAPGAPAPGAATPPPDLPRVPRPFLESPIRQYNVQPRTANSFDIRTEPLANGETAIIVAGGVILTVNTNDGGGLLDIEADRLVIWTKENPQELLGNMRRPEGSRSRQLEFYLSGNVEVREKTKDGNRTLRATEVYYDVGRNVAVASQADLEYRQQGFKDPIHLKAEELQQLGKTKFKAVKAEVFSSRLPSDPGLKIYLSEATLEEIQVPRRAFFGLIPLTDPVTGLPRTEEERLVRGRNTFFEVEDVPIFYWPWFQADAEDPLGPLQSFSFGQDQIFGTQIMTSWNVYDLIGIDPLPGTRWSLLADYLSDRGPALGTNFLYSNSTGVFGLPARTNGMVKAYGIYDQGIDNLGGNRGKEDDHPLWRGRLTWRQDVSDLPYGFKIQSQLGAFSDKNFYEQYWKQEFDTDINQDTFFYVKQQQANWAWTGLTMDRIRDWVTTTESLPRFDGYLIGQSFFDIFTYNAHASAGYLKLDVTNQPPYPPPIWPNEVDVSTGRFDIFQELSAPFSLGPVRFVPYGLIDLTSYTRDVNGDTVGRVYGGGGIRASIPFSRLYPEVQSDLFNLNGLNHKIVMGANWMNVVSNLSFLELPQLDRLNDDATDQALRDVLPVEPSLNPQFGTSLATSPLYNPQVYAIRRGITNRTDTLDDLQVFQLDLRQRLQTKRGFPGMQHIVDFMALDVSVSLFPDKTRDNFGEAWSFLEYDYLWNIGDRTAFTSSGWFDPFDPGPKVFTLGAHYNRTDRTGFFMGFRYIDPVESRALTGSVTYVFSPKYAGTAGCTYDFGTKQNQSTELSLTRIGSDFQVTFGVTYNAMQQNFGVKLEIVPNLIAQSGRYSGMKGIGLNQGFGGSASGR